MAIVHNSIIKKSRCAEILLHSGSRNVPCHLPDRTYPTATSFLEESASLTELELTVLP